MALAGVLIGVGIVGCGGSSGSAGGVSALLPHLPADATFVIKGDLRAARARLGMPANASFALRRSMTAKQWLLFGTAGGAIQDLELPSAPPLLRVLDPGRVTAALFVQSRSAYADLIATTQGQGALTRRLRSAGFVRRGAQWAAPCGGPPGLSTCAGVTNTEYVALFGGGIVESNQDGVVAGLAASNATKSSNAGILAQLAATSDEPAAAVAVYPAGCLKAVTIADRLSPRTGQLTIVTAGTPDPSRLHAGPLTPRSAAGVPAAATPKVIAGKLVATLTPIPGAVREPLPFTVVAAEALASHTFYPC